MTEAAIVKRFERLTTGTSQIYKQIQKIKKKKMSDLGLKGTQVMYLYYLYTTREGLTASDLCAICNEDKAGVSRTLSELEKLGFIRYEQAKDSKKYRAKAFLTDEGRIHASAITSLIIHISEKAGDGIAEEEREIFYRVLSVISKNLEKICEELSL